VGARLSTAEIVVVERRQVVVDEAEGVDQLQGAGGRQQLGRLPPQGLADRETENGPDALAASEKRIAQRLLQTAELVGKGQLGQRLVDEGAKLVGRSQDDSSRRARSISA
jgi:hypothetical protein